MQLKPSEIFYSQDSVSNTFDQKCRHAGTLIGETLDDICEGRCFIDDIPTLSVVQRDGKWITRDNRRLWVFRHLERLGKCDEIPVNVTYYIPEAKLTSDNGGQDIHVRRNPGGKWRYKPAKQRVTSNRRTQDRKIYDSSTSIPPKPLSNISNQQNYGTPDRQVGQNYDYSTAKLLRNQQSQVSSIRQDRNIYDYSSKPLSNISNQYNQSTSSRQDGQTYDYNTTTAIKQLSNIPNQQSQGTSILQNTYNYASIPLSSISNQQNQDYRIKSRETFTIPEEKFTKTYDKSYSTTRSSSTSSSRVDVRRTKMDDFDSSHSQSKRTQNTHTGDSERGNSRIIQEHRSASYHPPVIDQREYTYEENRGCCVIL